VAIVSAAAQLDVLDRRLAAGRARYDVVELDEAPFAAAMPVDGRCGRCELVLERVSAAARS